MKKAYLLTHRAGGISSLVVLNVKDTRGVMTLVDVTDVLVNDTGVDIGGFRDLFNGWQKTGVLMFSRLDVVKNMFDPRPEILEY